MGGPDASSPARKTPPKLGRKARSGYVSGTSYLGVHLLAWQDIFALIIPVTLINNPVKRK